MMLIIFGRENIVTKYKIQALIGSLEDVIDCETCTKYAMDILLKCIDLLKIELNKTLEEEND